MVLALAFVSVVPNMLAMENEKHIPDTKNEQLQRDLSFSNKIKRMKLKSIRKQRKENVSPGSYNARSKKCAYCQDGFPLKEEMMFEMEL